MLDRNEDSKSAAIEGPTLPKNRYAGLHRSLHVHLPVSIEFVNPPRVPSQVAEMEQWRHGNARIGHGTYH